MASEKVEAKEMWVALMVVWLVVTKVEMLVCEKV